MLTAVDKGDKAKNLKPSIKIQTDDQDEKDPFSSSDSQ